MVPYDDFTSGLDAEMFDGDIEVTFRQLMPEMYDLALDMPWCNGAVADHKVDRCRLREGALTIANLAYRLFVLCSDESTVRRPERPARVVQFPGTKARGTAAAN